MNHDLESALDELAARVEQTHRASGRSLPVAAIVADARRGRRRHAALLTASVAATVAVLAGTAFAVLPDRSPAPPAHTQSPSPSPSPSSSAPPSDAVVLPSGNEFLPFGTCGAFADAEPEFPVDDRFSIEAAPAPATVRAGEPLRVSGRIETPAWTDGSAGVTTDSGPTFVVTRDGVVVASTDVYGGRPTRVAYASEVGPTLALVDGSIPLTVCDQQYPAVSVGRPLPAGTYQLRSFTQVTPLGSDYSVFDGLDEGQDLQEIMARSGKEPITALGPVSTFTIVGDAPTPAPSPSAQPLDLAAPSPGPTCGDPAPDQASAAWSLHLSARPDRTTLPAGEPLEVTGTFSYDGPGRLRTYQSYVIDHLVVRDGVVVGDSAIAGDSLTTVLDVGTGSALEISGSSVLVEGCDNLGQPALGPGTYTVVPYVEVFNGRVTDDAVGVEEAESGPRVLGAPFTVTLTEG